MLDDALIMEIVEMGEDILASERFAKAWEVPHHRKDGTIARHSLETAGYALLLARWLAERGVVANEVDVVRASLLHDIGMTEDHVFYSPSFVKARSHPVVGERIAKEEFGANEVQAEAVLRHMWPVWFIIPPRTVEGWVVSLADKNSSVHEVTESVAAAGRWLMRMLGTGEEGAQTGSTIG